MEASPDWFVRSPELMSPGDSALVLVDVQERLVPAIDGHARVVWNCRRLLDAARLLGIPIVATEQYRKGLGPTVGELASRLEGVAIHEKRRFSAAARDWFAPLREQNVAKLLVCGIEAHVCVQQTVLDLLSAGWRVYVAVDAVGSRREVDRRVAIGRMDSSGATLTTTEAALFEWCESADAPAFKSISRLAKEEPPA